MKTQDFFTLLEQHQDKALVFEYAPNQYVDTNYHITEVKHVTIDAIDCGSKTDFWKETIVQLWESPSEIGKKDYMNVYKALAILKKVGKMKPYTLNAELKIEYSNVKFHTAQLFINDFEVFNRNLVIKLGVRKTDCKAKDVCGTPKIKEMASSVAEPCCAPDGNCC